MYTELEKYKPEENIVIHKDIRFNPDLTFGEKMFYAEIDALSKKGHCPFSSRLLSEFFGVSHQTILNWVKNLIRMNLVEVGIDYNYECRQFIKSKGSTKVRQKTKK